MLILYYNIRFEIENGNVTLTYKQMINIAVKKDAINSDERIIELIFVCSGEGRTINFSFPLNQHT